MRDWVALYLEPLLLALLIGAIWWGAMFWVEKIDKTP